MKDRKYVKLETPELKCTEMHDTCTRYKLQQMV